MNINDSNRHKKLHNTGTQARPHLCTETNEIKCQFQRC